MAVGNFDGASFDGSIGGFDVDEVISSGGYELANLGPRRREPEEIRQERVKLGILQERIIEDVAARQAADYKRDGQQKIEELRGEMRLQGLDLRSEHIEALNVRREQIINEELARLFRVRQDNEDVAILLMLAAAV